MPQMAPLSWVLLFAMFIILYLFNTMKIYFTSINHMSTDSKTTKSNLNCFNWKW